MATIVEVIFENGVLKPLTPTSLKERQRYRVTLEEADGEKSKLALTKPHPVLGRIVFHEDPVLPLDPEDWPMEDSDAPAS
jgi:predicted DNA-binding antitoxin AbrB/MazE fold protein